uniref:ribosomal protein S3 n=1 Tax=Pyropia dentata TaxID=76160 RepID=UPI00286C13E5|nr:ribosomal protein S3 [Neoporphyra dentata]WKD83574.1 ribosomal protein S3 [Neoporphyra dentata]
MGQKVNPRGFRVGVNNLWCTESQCYGKNFTSAKKLHKKILLTTNYLNKLLESKMFIKGYISSRIKDNKWHYSIAYVPLIPENDVSIQITKKSLFALFNIELQNYNERLWYQNGSLLCEFIKFVLQKGLPFRKIVTIIKMMFLNKKNYSLVLKTACGTQLFEFTGLKIKYAGRFGSSRSRMSNNVIFRTGSVSLQKLGTYIEFYEMPLYTKQGVCNLQVWMAYKISTT